MTIDDFTRSYLETALWSSNDESDEPMDANYGIEDLAPAALAAAVHDCQEFQEAHAEDIAGRESRAGHDFWLTRNGHGAGFWDGDWPEDVGERLTAASKVYGAVDLVVGDDGLIYGE